MLCGQIIERRAFLPPQLEQIRSADRCTENHSGSTTLEQKVRDDRRAMRNTAHSGGRRAKRRERRRHALTLIGGSREDFSGLYTAVGRNSRKIGVRPADIDSN
jgi:hypothetical protein